jgi:hypothetical protein
LKKRNNLSGLRYDLIIGQSKKRRRKKGEAIDLSDQQKTAPRLWIKKHLAERHLSAHLGFS